MFKKRNWVYWVEIAQLIDHCSNNLFVFIEYSTGQYGGGGGAGGVAGGYGGYPAYGVPPPGPPGYQQPGAPQPPQTQPQGYPGSGGWNQPPPPPAATGQGTSIIEYYIMIYYDTVS